jgi:hypothetical protein
MPISLFQKSIARTQRQIALIKIGLERAKEFRTLEIIDSFERPCSCSSNSY